MKRSHHVLYMLVCTFCLSAAAASQNMPSPEGSRITSVTVPIIGKLVWVPAGTFTQGTPDTEACRFGDEGPQFQHTLTQSLMAMETEVTRQMWADLKAAQPTLVNDPTDITSSPSMACPVQSLTWYQAILFANLLSVQQGLTRAYYKDAAFTQPVDALNYNGESIYCNFSTNGYRLPTEGEWEYFARAGTTGPFSVNEPSYSNLTCTSCTPGDFPLVYSAAWYCANVSGMAQHFMQTTANLWEVRDTTGNLYEIRWDWFGIPHLNGPQKGSGPPASGSQRILRGRSKGRTTAGAPSAYHDSLTLFGLLAGTAKSVGQKSPNPWGLKDLMGNLYEMCWDWYLDVYPSRSWIDYRGPASVPNPSDPLRVIRGGNWEDPPRLLRSGLRFNFVPSDNFLDTGFRLVKAPLKNWLPLILR